MAWVGDYSWSRPAPDVLHDAGCIGVVRYLGPGNHGRDVTAGEVRALHAAGLGVGLVWETTTTAALAGFRAGMGDVDAANRDADAIGAPDWLPIFLAVDTDVTPAQVRGPVADTFHGALQRSDRPVRPYGEADVLDILCGELGLMPCGWQCAAWSLGRRSMYRCMFQTWPPIMSATVDVNELGPMPTDFLWHPTITFATPLEHGDELDMATPAEVIGPIIAADTQNAENVAGEVRREADQTRRDVIGAIQSIEANLAGVVRGASAEELAAVLAQLKIEGQVPAELDVDALASSVAARLTVAPKT